MLKRNGTYYFLVPDGAPVENIIPPSYLRIENGQILLAYNSGMLAFTIGPGTYDAIIPLSEDSAIVCKFSITSSQTRLADCKKESVKLSRPSVAAAGYSSILDAVLESFNETTLVKLCGIIGCAANGTNSAEKVWHILEWVSDHIAYDYVKESRRDITVLSPLDLLRRGKGVCADYAVFTAAAVLGAGLKDAYILEIGTSPVPHAVAAVNINNTLYVMDQHLPPIELADYADHVLGSRSFPTYVLHIELKDDGLVVVGYRLSLLGITDTYPEDVIEEAVVKEAIDRAAIVLKETPSPQLSTVIQIGDAYVYLRLSLHSIGGLANKPVAIARLYSPTFREQWASWISSYIVSLVEHYYSESVDGGSFWAVIRDEQGATVIKVYAVPFKTPVVQVITNDILSLVVEDIGLDPYENIQILLYRPGEKTPCAGIVPKGYKYSNLPYIEADAWTKTGKMIIISIGAKRLQNLIRTVCENNAVLNVWVKDRIVYSTLLGKE
ncbi:hypothetical protein PYJP_08510 [Pyrofollis japonicus]|uniref:transglutaminase-like domain-containing protein n=1 Tax=Pyrofollis japonicus TaxID=3060460 RepID=UPI00295AC412|nr:transglutaminase-like domain-containing protein [Pyrofollis japonicus]BEP17499.1 hypothetical protein PYJP_08510 [Pyrofollis japonicus]